jgi:2-hydroxychromene-2-carboxylate isomerase
MACLMLVALVWVVRLIGGGRSRSGRHVPQWTGGTETDHRELARAIRGLPDRYRGRVPARTLRQVSGAGSAGKWEAAIDRLIMSLDAHAERVTLGEREELRAILKAMNMPGNRVDRLRRADEPPERVHASVDVVVA